MPPGVMSGGGGSGAILAAMDAGVAPGPASAGLPGPGPGGNDNGVHVQLQALAKLHDQKVRTLMRSIAELKKKLALATAQGKDHRRSALIRAMRTRLREQELVVDVVKEELGNKTGMGKEETNDWVIRKTVGGPLRFRPKTREELQNELYRLEKQHRQALNKLKVRSRAGRGDGVDVERGNAEEHPPAQLEAQADAAPEDTVNEGANPKQEQQAGGTEGLMGLSEALEEVDALRVSVQSRDAALQAQMQTIDQLQLENRELRGVQERLARKERRVTDLKKKNAHLGEQHTALLEDYEGCQEQARGRPSGSICGCLLAAIHHLKAQLALRKEEALAEADEFREHSLRQAEEVSVLLKREEELAAALEEEVAARQRERREQHHNNRQAISRVEAAEKSLQASEREGRRIRKQNETMVVELQRLGKEAAEAAGLRERGRELAVELKRMVKEAEARQGRLEEARDRGATAEEALRASKESLEAEKQSKEALSREVSESRALLEEERVRLEAERKRADEQEEARHRLESLLAAEQKKEEEMGIAAAAAAAEAAAQIAAANAAEAAAKEAAAALLAAEKGKGGGEDEGPSAGARRRTSGEGANAAEEDVAAKSRALKESEEIIEEMETELREHVEQITRLEEEKQALERQLESATKVADELRAKNSSLTTQLNAAVATAAAATAAAAAAEAEATPLPGKDEGSAPPSPRRHLRPSTSEEDKERTLREELAVAIASERAARNECRSLKLELDDARATCELQKTRVKDLAARKVSTILDDCGAGGGGPVATAADPAARS
eukprot:g9377.t1